MPEPSDASTRTGTDQIANPFRRPIDIRSLSLSGIFVLLLLFATHIGRPFLIPVVAAVLLSFLLSPAVALLVRWGSPPALAAAAVLIALVAIAGAGIYLTFDPAKEWLGNAPRHLARVETKVRDAFEPVEQVSQAAEKVEDMTKGRKKSNTVLSVDDGGSLQESILSGMQNLIAAGAIVLALLYFLLSTQDLFLRKLVTVLPRLEDKKRAVDIARQVQRDISSHLATITAINALLGATIGVAMYLLGMPNPVLWGIMAAVLNFVPYLGAAVGTFVVAVVALLTSDQLTHAVPVPLVYGALTAIEGGLITPAVLGRRLSLNPVIVFVSILFWSWIWGIPGALLAVPMLLVLKVFSDHVPPFAPLGEFLGR